MPAGGRGSLIKDAPKQAAPAGPPAIGMNALFSELNKVHLLIPRGPVSAAIAGLRVPHEHVISPAAGLTVCLVPHIYDSQRPELDSLFIALRPILYRETGEDSSSILLCQDQPRIKLCVLLQGETVTKGLKKVTDDMKTKNRADRSGVVSTSAGLTSTELLKWQVMIAVAAMLKIDMPGSALSTE